MDACLEDLVYIFACSSIGSCAWLLIRCHDCTIFLAGACYGNDNKPCVADVKTHFAHETCRKLLLTLSSARFIASCVLSSTRSHLLMTSTTALPSATASSAILHTLAQSRGTHHWVGACKSHRSTNPPEILHRYTSQWVQHERDHVRSSQCADCARH